MSSPTSQIIVHHIMRAIRICRPPHPNGILSSTIQTGWALFSINTTLPAIHTHLISQFACKQSTFHSVKGHNRTIKSRSGDGSRHLGMWWTIVLHISWSTVVMSPPLSVSGRLSSLGKPWSLTNLPNAFIVLIYDETIHYHQHWFCGPCLCNIVHTLQIALQWGHISAIMSPIADNWIVRSTASSTSKKIPKLCITSPLWGKPPVTGGKGQSMNAKSVSMSWRLYGGQIQWNKDNFIMGIPLYEKRVFILKQDTSVSPESMLGSPENRPIMCGSISLWKILTGHVARERHIPAHYGRENILYIYVLDWPWLPIKVSRCF